MSESLSASRVDVFSSRVEALLEVALSEWRMGNGCSAIASASAAIAAMKIFMGELDEYELDGYPFPGEERDESGCICPPEMVARGGFKGGCPVHGGGGTA